MSKKNLFFALAVMIGFIFTACNNGVNNNEFIPPKLNPIGTLTITGLDSYNNKYASAVTYYTNYNGNGTYSDLNGLHLVAYDVLDYNIDTRSGLISNGSVTLKVWEGTSTSKFSGDGKVVFYLLIGSQATGGGLMEFKIEISFVNWIGIGTGVRVD